jgi:hypothetical protein
MSQEQRAVAPGAPNAERSVGLHWLARSNEFCVVNDITSLQHSSLRRFGHIGVAGLLQRQSLPIAARRPVFHSSTQCSSGALRSSGVLLRVLGACPQGASFPSDPSIQCTVPLIYDLHCRRYIFRPGIGPHCALTKTPVHRFSPVVLSAPHSCSARPVVVRPSSAARPSRSAIMVSAVAGVSRARECVGATRWQIRTPRLGSGSCLGVAKIKHTSGRRE